MYPLAAQGAAVPLWLRPWGFIVLQAVKLLPVRLGSHTAAGIPHSLMRGWLSLDCFWSVVRCGSTPTCDSYRSGRPLCPTSPPLPLPPPVRTKSQFSLSNHSCQVDHAEWRSLLKVDLILNILFGRGSRVIAGRLRHWIPLLVTGYYRGRNCIN